MSPNNNNFITLGIVFPFNVVMIYAPTRLPMNDTYLEGLFRDRYSFQKIGILQRIFVGFTTKD
jgi:hypothetical protein